MSPDTRSDEHDHRPFVEIAACAALALVPYLWRVAAGTRGLPNDDTWAYERILRHWAQTGDLVFIDWNDITLIGMFPFARAWMVVFDDSTAMLALLGVVMGFVALMALRSMLRMLDAPLILWALVCFGAFSGFVVTTGTFMADQFALAGGLVAMAAALRLATTDVSTVARVVLALVVVSAGTIAVACRQQYVVLVAAAMLVLLAGHPRRPWYWLWCGLGFTFLVVPFYIWRFGVENGGSVLVSLNTPTTIVSTVVMVVAVCCVIFPLVVRMDGAGALLHPVAHSAIGLAGGALLVTVDVAQHIADYLSPVQAVAGASSPVRVVAGVVAANVVAVVAVALSRRRPDRARPIHLALCAATLVSLAADLVVIISGDYYSRYSLTTLSLLIPSLLIARPASVNAVVEPTTWVRVGAFAAVATLFGSSLWALDAAQTPVRLSIDLADRAACAGVPSDRLDAGLVWIGSHTSAIARADAFGEPMIDDGLPITQHHRVFPDYRRDAVLLEERPDDGAGYEVLGPFHERGLLPGGDATMWLAVRDEVLVGAPGGCGLS